MSKKTKRNPAVLYKIISKINNEIFYTSEDYPTKIIDGKKFLGVKKYPSDKTLNYVLKENVTRYSNE